MGWVKSFHEILLSNVDLIMVNLMYVGGGFGCIKIGRGCVFLRSKNFGFLPTYIKDNVVIGDNNLFSSCNINENITIGNNNKLREIYIFNSCRIGDDNTIDIGGGIENNVVIGNNNIIGKDVHIGPYSTIGDNVTIKDNVIIEGNSVISNDVILKKNCVVKFHSFMQKFYK